MEILLVITILVWFFWADKRDSELLAEKYPNLFGDKNEKTN